MTDPTNEQNPAAPGNPDPQASTSAPSTGPTAKPAGDVALSDQSVAAQALAASQVLAPRGPDRRKSAVDRRAGVDRRQMSREESGYTGPERRSGIDRRAATGLERRRGPGRRRSDERKSAEEGEMTVEQFEFIQAIQTYKKVNRKLYPTWTEVLEVVRQLGYRKVLPREIRLEGVPEPKVYKHKDAA